MSGGGVCINEKTTFIVVQGSMCTHVLALKFRRLTSPQHAGGGAFLRGLCLGKNRYKFVSATTISTILLICHQLCLLVSWQCCVSSPDILPDGNGYCNHSLPAVPVSCQICLAYKHVSFCLCHCLWLLMSRVLNPVPDCST